MSKTLSFFLLWAGTSSDSLKERRACCASRVLDTRPHPGLLSVPRVFSVALPGLSENAQQPAHRTTLSHWLQPWRSQRGSAQPRTHESFDSNLPPCVGRPLGLAKMESSCKAVCNSCGWRGFLSGFVAAAYTWAIYVFQINLKRTQLFWGG